MNIRLIALDLDDTTLSTASELTEFNKNALIAAIENGIEVVIASVRNFYVLPPEVTEISGVRYAIVSNGAAIYDIAKKERLVSYCVPAFAVDMIFELKKQFPDSRADLIIEGKTYTSKHNFDYPLKFGKFSFPPKMMEYFNESRFAVEDLYSFGKENSHRIDSINVAFKNPDDRLVFKKLLEEKTDELYVTSSMDHLLEIVNPNAGKGSGLRSVCEILGIPLSATAACGNADNDIDMLKCAAVGAAVENATDSCKAAADVIIPKNTEDGVGKFIYEILQK